LRILRVRLRGFLPLAGLLERRFGLCDLGLDSFNFGLRSAVGFERFFDLPRRGRAMRTGRRYSTIGRDLTAIDGISPEGARVVVSEIGPDITVFPSEKHFISGGISAHERPFPAANRSRVKE
jgi:hypothetical protein